MKLTTGQKIRIYANLTMISVALTFIGVGIIIGDLIHR